MDKVIYSPGNVNIMGALRKIFDEATPPIVAKLQKEFEERFRVELASLAVRIANEVEILTSTDPTHFGGYVEINVRLSETKPISEEPKQ